MRQKTFGKLVVSLDFELFWGFFDHETKDGSKERIFGARDAVVRMLELFDSYGIHATWAVVGMLMAENKEEIIAFSPEEKPSYINTNLSAYNHLDLVGEDENDDKFHYASNLVSKILSSKNQELASHTYSHYYCKEDGQTPSEFEADLIAAKRIALQKYGVELKSLVLPRNNYREDYLSVVTKVGFTAIRGNQTSFAYNNKYNLYARAIRLIDAYFNISGKKSYCIENAGDSIVNIKASAFFRKFNNKLRILEPLKVSCIKRQMKAAAKHGEVFHMWWHPHNIGIDLDKSLMQLKSIFDYYIYLNERYGFQSMNMGEVADSLYNK